MLGACAPSGTGHGPRQAAPPDLCALAGRLGEDSLITVCGDVRHLGYGTFQELRLVADSVNVLAAFQNADGKADLGMQRHFFAYGDFVVTVRDDAEGRLDVVLRTAAALAAIRDRYPEAYRFMTAMRESAITSHLAQAPWKNRYERIFISFDRTPKDIAAAVSVLGQRMSQEGVDHFVNYAIISIDEETILGATPGQGSQAIYHRPSAAENYRAYMADGLIYSLLHEATHSSIDHANSTSPLANAIYFARGSPGARDAEEVIANTTGLSFVASGMSQEMRDHVAEQNTRLTRDPDVRARLDEWSRITGPSRSPFATPR